LYILGLGITFTVNNLKKLKFCPLLENFNYLHKTQQLSVRDSELANGSTFTPKDERG